MTNYFKIISTFIFVVFLYGCASSIQNEISVSTENKISSVLELKEEADSGNIFNESYKSTAEANSYNKTDIEYCEDVSPKIFQCQYSNIEQLYDDLKLNALRKAVKKLLSQEIEKIRSGAFTNIEEIIDASRNFIKFDKIEKTGQNVFKPCVVLKNCYVSKEDKKRYDKVQIAKISGYDSNLLQQQTAKIKQDFISSLKTGKPDFKQMINDPKQLKHQTYQQLSRLIHTETMKPNPDTLKDTKSKAFFVYPIEIYTASSQR